MSNAYGVGVLTVIIGISACIIFYQNFYLPESLAKPSVADEILNPEEITMISIVSGSANADQIENYVPNNAVVILGKNNKVVWSNDDSTGHTVTADHSERDKYSGAIYSNGIISSGEVFEFIFTEPIELHYHCDPHPWMKASITVEHSRF